MSISALDKVVRGADLTTIGSAITAKLEGKQDTLVSGTNIKTVNNTSLVGSGNITIHDGVDGADGKSAYEIWLDEGNTGSEQDFLASLQGDSGYSGAAGELEVVNNLTEGGATAALSAQQGIVLKGKTEIVTTYTLSSYSNENARINSDGEWNNTARYRHIIIPVEAGVLLRVQANSSYDTTYAFLTRNDTPVNNTAAPLVSGTSIVSITAGGSTEVTIPDTTKYLYVYGGDLNVGSTHVRDYLPSFVSTTRVLTKIYQEVQSNATAIAELSTQVFDIQNVVTSSLTLRVCKINASGDWINQSRYRHVIYPVSSGTTVNLTANGNYNAEYAFLTSDATPVMNTAASLVSGTSRHTVTAGTTDTFTIPSGCNFLYIFSGDRNSGDSHKKDNLPSSVVLKRSLSDAFDSIDEIKNGEASSGSIIAVNPQEEWLPKMISAKKRYYTSTTTDKEHPVVIAHFSDLHSNWGNATRFLEFCNHYSGYIDCMLNTGDTVLGLFTDGFDGYTALDGIENVLNIVGNHETRGEEDGWQQYVGLPVYNAIIAPYVSGWDVEQPEDAATNGYCYYYKDFTDQKLRLVCIDIMGYDETEDAWLETVLADALSNSYDVVIASHFSGARDYEHQDEAAFTKVDCNYTTLYSLGSSASGLYGYNPKAYLMNASVNTFINAGGRFVGYIQGHYHCDFVAKSAEYPNQFIYSIGASKAGEFRDYNHIPGTRAQDEFQIISIDTYLHIVKLFKVGANVDLYGRHKNSICIDYVNGTIKAEGY